MKHLKAIVLAGGFGTRLKEVVADVPKPMAPINGIPFLNFVLSKLAKAGIRHTILSVGYMHEIIESHFKNDFKGMKISYVIENEPLGTGGAIKKCMEDNPNTNYLVLNGDTMFDIDFESFYQLHKSQEVEISLALRKVENACRYGEVILNDRFRIVSFQEKNEKEIHPGLINAGIYIIKRSALLDTIKQTKFSIEKDFFEPNTDKLFMLGQEFNNYFIDIGIPSDYHKAQDDFKQFDH